MRFVRGQVAMLDNLLPKTYYCDLSGVMLDVRSEPKEGVELRKGFAV